MTNDEAFAINLPKWPAIVVFGTPVTKEQAEEIVIRTDDFWFSSNDPKFLPQLFWEMNWITAGEKILLDQQHMTSLSLYVRDDDPDKDALDKIRIKIDEKLEELKKKINHLGGLEYLANHQILSSWVGGPHGWCSWTGKIMSNHYNIGKWPSVQEVHREWTSIAEAFPFLDLSCILFSGETCEENSDPLIEFVVKNGQVSMKKPDNPLSPVYRPNDLSESAILACVFQNSSSRERGIQPDALAAILKRMTSK